MGTRAIDEGLRAGRPALRLGWVGWFAAVAITSVVIASLVFVTRPSTTTTVERERVTPLYTQQEQAVMQLVAQGLIPAATLEGEPYRTKQLINQGLIPAETLLARAVQPLYCPDELATIAAVAAGELSPEVLDEEPFRTKQLITLGLIPRAAADPC
jgi:hypothetical protein